MSALSAFATAAIIVLSFESFMQVSRLDPTVHRRLGRHRQLNKRTGTNNRDLSINLGGGECLWTAAEPLGKRAKVFGTVLSAYPGSGMRLLWQHAEGLTGIQVGDDFNLHPNGADRSGIIKTHYPHIEGIWSWKERMSQSVLIVRNPRWALPSYHNLIFEIRYAVDWATAYKFMGRLFKKRPSVEAWIRWRDHRFSEEVLLWKWFIDYWMYGGEQYWMDGDYERTGARPFHWVNGTDRKADPHCIYELECEPKAVLSYELLRDPLTGPKHANKLAQVLDGKMGIDVIDEEARECVWHQTEIHKPDPDNLDRDNTTDTKLEEFDFTYPQMLHLREAVEEMQVKYSSGEWKNSTVAEDLVGYFDMYIEELDNEIELLEANLSPTAAPDPRYQEQIAKWYNRIGRGDRYAAHKQHEASARITKK